MHDFHLRKPLVSLHENRIVRQQLATTLRNARRSAKAMFDIADVGVLLVEKRFSLIPCDVWETGYLNQAVELTRWKSDRGGARGECQQEACWRCAYQASS